jgi:putative phage-type endonuclease
VKILEVQQGSVAWNNERARRFTASEAPAMMGASKFTSRSDLLRQKATGIAPEVTPQKQALFDRGHATEASARVIVEEMLGQELYPATAVSDDDDRLLASFDGVTMLEDVIYEHKLWSEELAAKVRTGELEPHYFWQLEQQLLVSGAERAIFVCSDGTRERFVHMEYRPVAGRREQLIAAWQQFAADLAAYTPPAASAVEKIVAEPVEALPAPVVQVSGQLALQDNFKVFEERLRHFLEHRLIRQPKSDEDFVNLDAQIKSMKHAREALSAAEAQMLAQVEPVDRAKKTKDMLDKLLQQNLSMAERLLKEEKERRRGEIVAAGAKAFQDHIDALHARLGKPYLPQIPTDFGGCIKGLKSLASMEDKVATELARAKIAANEVADRIDANLKALREMAADYRFLFNDAAVLVLKAPDDCRAVITSRIAEHKQAEEKRAAELAERERARIRQEEADRLEREQAVQRRIDAIKAAGPEPLDQAPSELIASAIRTLQSCKLTEDLLGDRLAEAADARITRLEQLEIAHADAVEREQAGAAPAPTPAPAPIAPPAVSSQAPAASAPADNVVPIQRQAAASTATIRLGQISERLGFALTAEFVGQLGYHPVATEKAAKLYRLSDFDLICEALIAHVRTVQAKQLQAA